MVVELFQRVCISYLLILKYIYMYIIDNFCKILSFLKINNDTFFILKDQKAISSSKIINEEKKNHHLLLLLHFFFSYYRETIYSRI